VLDTCSKQAAGHVTKLLHMLLTQLATVGLVATALQSELPGAACGDLCASLGRVPVISGSLGMWCEYECDTGMLKSST
jgi:hypothetical protein